MPPSLTRIPPLTPAAFFLFLLATLCLPSAQARAQAAPTSTQAASPSTGAPKLNFTHLSGEQGLSNSTIEAIYQDSRGFIWIGTRDGLNRFDGHEMQVYRYAAADTNSISDSYIRCISEDRFHQLWVGTMGGLNRLDPATNHFIRYRHRDGDAGSLSHNGINALLQDYSGRLWIATAGGGLNRFDPATGTFLHLREGPAHIFCMVEDRDGSLWIGAQTGLYHYLPGTGTLTPIINPAATNPSGNRILAIQKNRQGNLWLGTEDDGLFLFDPLQKTFTRYAHSDTARASLGNNMIKCLLTDHLGRLWSGSINGGLNLFNAPAGSFFNYAYEPGIASSLSQRTVSALFEDRQGNIWIGTHRGGINIYSPGTGKFNLYRQEASLNSLSYNDVRTFCEDNSGDGNIWIGTDGGGLDLFNRNRQTFRHYTYNPFNNKSLGSNAVLDVMQDREGALWVSTWGGGLNLFDKTKGAFTRYQSNPADPHSISSNFVQATFEDDEGRLWVATYYGGLNLFDRKTRQFTRITVDPTGKTSLTGNNIVSLLEDKEGRIWIGTDDGGLNCYHQDTRHFTHYFNTEEKMPDLRVLFTDSKGRLWVGQKGLYLLDAARDSFRLYTDTGGLATEFIKGITEDKQGNLWIATSNGLIRFNPGTASFKKYNTGDGLQGLEFEANAYLKTKDGELFFGGINGFNCFYPGAIRSNPFIPPVYITTFQLSNRKILPGEKGGPLEQDISLTREIRLSYRQSTFSFNFAALNYTTPENNQFAYRLEGLDKDWNYVGKEYRAVYTNLGPGEYTFHVKAANNDGLWNEKGTSIRIIITPPFWKTDWFIALLALVGAACLYAFFRFRTRLKLKELEAAKKEEIRQVQLQFFTNVSHEFRTPLSLILGPLEKMMKETLPSSPSPTPAFQRYYQTMYRNARRLLSLINELMDFGKLESGSLHLSVQHSHLNTFMEEIAEEFRDWAIQKEIDFTLQLPTPSPDTWFDRQVVEKIVLNLLHNAFKYTKTGGHIALEVRTSLDTFHPSFANELILKNNFRGASYAYIRVADNGIGISKDSIHHLFERYYRITESHLGSGVGLAFVKSLALLHKGDIYVYSERLEGTEILIGIPIGENDYRKEEKRSGTPTEGGIRLESSPAGLPACNDPRDPSTPRDPASEDYSPSAALPPLESILLVEDNDELRRFLKEQLGDQYEVLDAPNGKDGLALAKEISPGFIITDVIMPGMNGFDLCRAVKQDIDTSHIPVLILTARTAMSSQVEGLDAGADYYFAKPLNMELLLLTIRNRFDQDRKLKERYSHDSHVQAMDLVHTEKDKEFMTRLLEIIESQLANPDFEIGYLCQEMGMSRTRLYQKIKSISRQSIGDFIRTIRLKKAVQIMTHEDVSLTEVMVRIGIQTQSYFTKAFKKEFGKTPTQFIQEIKKL
jgi:ligand-binding sensor domain-containing protein/signal transduction histidine kinase/DNA-binding response OmpR family regulator